MTTYFNDQGDQVESATQVLDPDVDTTEEERLRSRKPAIAIMAGFVAVVLVLFGFALWPRSSADTATVTGPRLSADPRGAMAPVFSGNEVNSGNPVSLADYKGKTVVVNFWASWCTTCKQEAQVVADVEKKWRDKGVVFLGVDTHDTTAGAHTYYRTYGLEYPSINDTDSRVGATYSVSGLPETFFINTKGEIVDKYVSAVDEKTLDGLIAEAVAAG